MRSFLLLFVFFFFFSCSALQNSPAFYKESDEALLYRVKRIKAKGGYYIIYATRKDSTYKIISEVVDSTSARCEVVKKNQSYHLDLQILFPRDSVLGKSMTPNLGIRGIRMANGDLIEIEEESHNTLYLALNLRGLCIKR